MPEPSDPHAPEYRPRYTGSEVHPDVEDSKEFGVQLYELYKAGRVHLPNLAAEYEQLARSLHGLEGTIDNLYLREYGPLPARLQQRAGDAHRILRSSCLIMADIGRALVETADAYVQTDDEAVGWFVGKLEQEPEEYQEWAHVPVPPKWGQPASPTPDWEQWKPPMPRAGER
jgi:hypothetical protein